MTSSGSTLRPSTVRYVQEALAIGVVTVVIGLLVSAAIISAKTLLSSSSSSAQPEASAWGWMALGLFVTGFTTHVLFENLQLNAWYCEEGNACLSSPK